MYHVGLELHSGSSELLLVLADVGHLGFGVRAPGDEQVGLLVLVAEEHVPDRHARLLFPGIPPPAAMR